MDAFVLALLTVSMFWMIYYFFNRAGSIEKIERNPIKTSGFVIEVSRGDDSPDLYTFEFVDPRNQTKKITKQVAGPNCEGRFLKMTSPQPVEVIYELGNPENAYIADFARGSRKSYYIGAIIIAAMFFYCLYFYLNSK